MCGVPCKALFGDLMADLDKAQFGKEVMAVVWRYAHESELTLREMVQALHGCAETVMFLEERRDGDVELDG